MSAALAAGEATIHWPTWPASNAVEVRGIEPEVLVQLAQRAPRANGWDRILAVYAEPAAGAGVKTSLPPMAGTWRVQDDELRFEPQFPLAQGVRYRAEYRDANRQPVISFFELPPAAATAPTEVRQIYPSASVLPENQLKFYVQFSGPMSRGGTYEHVHIRDAQGRVIDLPFLELDEELWDPEMTRLTLLIDPGRIKRGVKPLEDIGPVFEKGNSYALTLDASCRDAAGRPLRQSFEKKFRIGPADRTPPDPGRWQIAAPQRGTRAPLVVTFDEPMDQALALRLIRVVAESRAVGGEPALERAEQEWRFTPDSPWKPGAYRLSIATTIEDLAGNNIGKTFDVDLAAGARRRLAAGQVEVPFEVK